VEMHFKQIAKQLAGSQKDLIEVLQH